MIHKCFPCEEAKGVGSKPPAGEATQEAGLAAVVGDSSCQLAAAAITWITLIHWPA